MLKRELCDLHSDDVLKNIDRSTQGGCLTA